MDNRHLPPMLSVKLSIDWANPLWYWFLGVTGTLIAAIVLALV